jgi:hypothetical protein
MESSNLICKLYSSSNYSSYRAVCGCTSGNHSHDVSISVEGDDGFVSVVIYSTLRSCDYSAKEVGAFKKLYSRIKRACRILFTGDLEVEGEFIFQSKEQVDDYVEAIKSGIKHVESSVSNLR